MAALELAVRDVGELREEASVSLQSAVSQSESWVNSGPVDEHQTTGSERSEPPLPALS